MFKSRPIWLQLRAGWFAILVVGMSISCKPHAEPATEAAKQPLPRVSVAKAVEHKVIEYVHLVGRTTAYEKVDIRSRVSGFLRKKHFKDGQKVEAGDVLYNIEPDQYLAIYNQSLAKVSVGESKLKLAEAEFRRFDTLRKSNAVSQNEYDIKVADRENARAELLAAKADAARTKLDVDYTTIKSPISGRVDLSLIDDGNYVTGGALGGTILTTVVSDGVIRAMANVDENVVLTVRRRMRQVAGDKYQEKDHVRDMNIPCQLQLGDEKDYPHQGIVEYVQVRVNQTTGTTTLRGEFKNADGLLRDGMFVRLRVPITDEFVAVLVPDRAIGTDQATRFVYIVDKDQTIQHREVELGERNGQMRIVKSGVRTGETVVTAGLQLIQPGMKVQPEFTTPEKSSEKAKDPPTQQTPVKPGDDKAKTAKPAQSD